MAGPMSAYMGQCFPPATLSGLTTKMSVPVLVAAIHLPLINQEIISEQPIRQSTSVCPTVARVTPAVGEQR
jgi:hypothetical protein